LLRNYFQLIKNPFTHLKMRYLALTKEDRQAMLKAIGVNSVNNLYDSVHEKYLLNDHIKNLAAHQGEMEVESCLTKLSSKNRPASKGAFFLGAGIYNHHIPASVDHIIQ